MYDNKQDEIYIDTRTGEYVSKEIAAEGWATNRYVTLEQWRQQEAYIKSRTEQDIEDKAQRGWF